MPFTHLRVGGIFTYIMNNTSRTLGEIADYLNAELQGDSNCVISGIAPLDKARPGQISFLTSSSYRQYLPSTQASAVVLPPEQAQDAKINALVMSNPYYGFARLGQLFSVKPNIQPGNHPSAVISANSQLGDNVSIGPNVVIEDDVVIGNNVVIAANCFIGCGARIGEQTQLASNVSIQHHVTLGARVIIHSGVVIGGDGFGMASHEGKWCRIPQLGSVQIGDDVEIGANSAIDRGALENTVIGNGVKIDNLCQIAHNVHIGENTVIAGCAAIAGSVKIGNNCLFGGGVRFNGHIEVCDNVQLAGTAVVMRSITKPGAYASGVPLMPIADTFRSIASYKKLPEIVKRIAKLEKKIK